MRAELGLPSVKGDDEHGGGMTGGFGGSMGGAGQTGKGKRPINVKFEIPYFTTSGIQVRYLKIIEPKVSDMANHLFSFLLDCFIIGTQLGWQNFGSITPMLVVEHKTPFLMPRFFSHNPLIRCYPACAEHTYHIIALFVP